MISTALAADASASAAPFFHSPDFWVAVAFVLLIVLVGRKAYNLVGTALDDRADGIRAKIDEATRLRDEAQQLLAANQRKQREAAKEAEAIITHAREEAERIRARATTEMEHALARREQMAKDRIAQAEARALADVQNAAAELAIETTRKVLADQIVGAKADAMIDAAISELPNKLH